MKLTTDIEDQVDAIRDKIYEKIKDMTPAEHVAYYKAIADEARKRGFRVIRSPKEDAQQKAEEQLARHRQTR